MLKTGELGLNMQLVEIEENRTSKLLFHPSFEETIAELKKRKIILPISHTNQEIDFSRYGYPQEGALISCVEDFGKFDLDANKGEQVSNSTLICAYDESVEKFEGLQGTAFLTSHSMVIHGLYDYIPVNLLTFYFYTSIFVPLTGLKLHKIFRRTGNRLKQRLHCGQKKTTD